MMASQTPPNNQQLVYLIFAREVGPLVKAKYPQIQKVQFNKILGRIWNEMPGSERDKYHQKAEVQLKMQKVSDLQTNIKEEPNSEKLVVSNTCATANTSYPSDGLEKGDNTLNKIPGTSEQSEILQSDVTHTTYQPPGSSESMTGKLKHSSMTQEIMKQYPMFPMYYKSMCPTLRKIYAGKTEEEIKLIAFTMFQEMVLTDANKRPADDTSKSVTIVSSEPSQQEEDLNKIVAVESVSESSEKTENFLLRDEETLPLTTQVSLEEACKSKSVQNVTLSDKNPEEISNSIDYGITSIKEEPSDENQLLAEDIGPQEVPLDETTSPDANRVDETVGESSSDGGHENADELEIAMEGTPIIGNPEQTEDTNIAVEVSLDEAIFTDAVVDNSEESSDGLSTVTHVAANFDTESIAIESVESLAKNVNEDELSFAISTITESPEPINKGGEGEGNSEDHESKQNDSDARVIFHNLGFFIKNEQNDINVNEDDNEKTDLAPEPVEETSNAEELRNNADTEELADEEPTTESTIGKGSIEEEAINEEAIDKVSDEEEEIEEDTFEDELANEKNNSINVNLPTAKESPITSIEKTNSSEISSFQGKNSPLKSSCLSQQVISKDSPVSLQNDYQKTIVKEEQENNASSSDQKNPSEPNNLGKDSILKPTYVALPKVIARPEQKHNITSDMKSLIDKLVTKKTPDKDVIRQMVVKTRANMKPAEKPGSTLNYRKTPNSTTIPPTVTEESTSTSNQTLFCYCRSPSSKDLIGCDYCPEWFHPTCLGLSKYELRMVLSLSNWKCPECIKKSNGVKKAVKARIDASRIAFKNKSSPNIHAPSPPGKTIKLSTPENINSEKTGSVKNVMEKSGEKEKNKCDTCHILVMEVKKRGAVIERLEKRIAELESRK